MKSCPECDRPLGASATGCKCGWHADAKAAVRPIIACAHLECGTSAMIREKTVTGWANFCLHHYEQYHHTQALVTYRKLGLERWPDETRKDHERRVFDYIGLMSKVPIRKQEAA